LEGEVGDLPHACAQSVEIRLQLAPRPVRRSVPRLPKPSFGLGNIGLAYSKTIGQILDGLVGIQNLVAKSLRIGGCSGLVQTAVLESRRPIHLSRITSLRIEFSGFALS